MIQNLTSGGVLRAIGLGFVIIAVVGALFGIVTGALGQATVQRAADAMITKFDQVCINPKGC